MIKDGAGHGGSCGGAYFSGVARAAVYVPRMFGSGGDSKSGAAPTQVHPCPREGAWPQSAAPTWKFTYSHWWTGRSVLFFLFLLKFLYLPEYIICDWFKLT